MGNLDHPRSIKPMEQEKLQVVMHHIIEDEGICADMERSSPLLSPLHILFNKDCKNCQKPGKMSMQKNTESDVIHSVNKQMADKERALKKMCSSRILLLPVVFMLFLLVIALTLLVAKRNISTCQPAAADLCTGDWIPLRGKCYFFSDDQRTWNNSRDFCIENNSTLVTIDDKQELNFLMRAKGSDNHWIGLSREDDSGWVWINRTPYQAEIFHITQLSPLSNLEHAFLNRDGVKSEANWYDKKWICMKR